MFSASVLLISGQVFQGLILIGILVFFAASYIILSRNGNRFPTNLSFVGCILCAIAVDVVWSLFNFGSEPLFTVGVRNDTTFTLFCEFLSAGVIFFSGIILTDIVKTKSLKKTKIILLIIFLATISLIALNALSIRSVEFKFAPFNLPVSTVNITLTCLACAEVIALVSVALASRKMKSALAVATALILALITIALGTVGVMQYLGAS